MSALHHLVPMFLLIQFVFVLVALVSAMLFAEPQFSISTGRYSRPIRSRSTTDSHD